MALIGNRNMQNIPNKKFLISIHCIQQNARPLFCIEVTNVEGITTLISEDRTLTSIHQQRLEFLVRKTLLSLE